MAEANAHATAAGQALAAVVKAGEHRFLNAKERAIFALRLAEFTFAEIAELLHLSAPQVQESYKSARGVLEQIISGKLK